MAAATPGLPFSTRLTVASLTPAWAAMSASRAVTVPDCTGRRSRCPPSRVFCPLSASCGGPAVTSAWPRRKPPETLAGSLAENCRKLFPKDCAPVTFQFRPGAAAARCDGGMTQPSENGHMA
ncbi:hypothetical protein GCM10009716_04460 [Streptomyces sodiiphilus]|uniref:Secreted protein n=1 Tax=Streptomyces sodiiphilus TaxID=226217 RepID=A0ABN2NUD4_9ACTN